MLNQQLNDVGMSTFIKYFEYFNNETLSNSEVKDLITDDYTDKSKSSRTSKARKIIREGKTKEALELIINSGKKVDDSIKAKANDILNSLLPTIIKADSNIPDGITAKEIRLAAKDFINKSIEHRFIESTTYDVIIDGNRYPPKAIIGLASRYILGHALTPSHFSAGLGTKCFRVLKENGFSILSKENAIVYPDVIDDNEKHFEGLATRVTVNRYERDDRARAKCIEHYGLKCSVCEFDFEQTYGDLGAGFIHVHHLTLISSIGEEYHIDPIKDLRPVCPNCHAMLHKRKKPLSIEELRTLMKKAPGVKY